MYLRSLAVALMLTAGLAAQDAAKLVAKSGPDLAAAAATPTTSAKPPAAAAATVATFEPVVINETRSVVLGANDSITINAPNADELTRTWRISSNGYLDLPMVGRMKAAGLTVDEFEEALTQKLGKYVKVPTATVAVADLKSRPVTISGAVERGGVLQLTGYKTLFDVVTSAGLKDTGPKMTLTRRADMGKPELPNTELTGDAKFYVTVIDVQDVAQGRSEAARIEMRPFDVVSVPSRQARLVHIVGEVSKPGAVELVSSGTVSMTKLIAVAGGFTRSAAPRKVMIRRIGPNNLSTETAIVDAKNIVTGKATDLELAEGDIVIVPSSQLMTYVTSLSQTAMSSGIFSGFQILARF